MLRLQMKRAFQPIFKWHAVSYLSLPKRNYQRSCVMLSPMQKSDELTLHLHISPCGDWWLGTEIYAAKHLPSGYVRSIKLPDDFDEDSPLLHNIPKSSFLAMYDTGFLDTLFVVAPPADNGRPPV